MRCKFLLILCLQMSVVLAAYNSSTLRNSSDSNGNGLRVQSSKIQYAVKNTRIKEENLENSSLVTEENEESDLKSMICSTFPGTCSRLASFSKQLLRLGSAFEGRGPKDLIAIVSTMLATLLGAILVKLNVLIVLSLISVGIGKILVVLLTLKSHLFAHKTQSPIVYEKVFYPHHNKEFINQLPQSYQVQEDYPTYNFSR